MVTEDREIELMDRAAAALKTAGVPTMPRDEQAVFLSSMMTLAFMLLRTVENDEAAREWLESAFADLANPPVIEIRKLS